MTAMEEGRDMRYAILLTLGLAMGCRGTILDKARSSRMHVFMQAETEPLRLPAASTAKPQASPAEPKSADAFALRYEAFVGPKMVDDRAEFGCDDTEYRWVQGRVQRLHVNRERVWQVRYAPYDRLDRFGGSFILDGVLPAELNEGDLVRIEGTLPADAKTGEGSGVRYRCQRVRVLAPANGK